MYTESITVQATAIVITSLYLYFFITERLDRIGLNIPIYLLYPYSGGCPEFPEGRLPVLLSTTARENASTETIIPNMNTL